MLRISLFILTIAITTSCLEWNNRTDLTKLNTLTHDVDSLAKVQKQNFTVNVDSLIEIRCGLIYSYKTQKTTDTITIETAQHLENLKFSCANLHLYKQHDTLFNTLKLKQKELAQLHAIISKGIGNRSEYNNLILTEQKNIQNLKSNFQQLHHYYIDGIRNFEESEYYLRALLTE